MNENIKRALQYIKNTGGNCPMSAFLDDHDPIGEKLLDDIRGHSEGLWTYDSNNNMILTDAGRNALQK